jgi:hypothetical protein
MANESPIACSLGAGELEQRLTEIAEVGAASLISRTREGDRHLLRFRDDATTRQRLEAIIAAEAECCSFLDLSLSEDAGELVLSIGAPQDAEEVAAALAKAFIDIHQ